MTKPTKSHGRKSIEATAKPRALMTGRPDLHGAWTAKVITLLPQHFPGVLGASLTGKALEDGLWQLQTIDLRSFGIGKHRNSYNREHGAKSNVEDAGRVPVPVVAPCVEHRHVQHVADQK